MPTPTHYEAEVASILLDHIELNDAAAPHLERIACRLSVPESALSLLRELSKDFVKQRGVAAQQRSPRV
jgi:hypothetical protein